MQVWLDEARKYRARLRREGLGVRADEGLGRSAREPTARMRPPAMAIASAVGWASSRVTIDPVTRSLLLSRNLSGDGAARCARQG